MKGMSCKRCQFRKLRCSRTKPCQSCATASQTCEYREDDQKRRPSSREYVTGLENRVAQLEHVIRQLESQRNDSRKVALENTTREQIDTGTNRAAHTPAQHIQGSIIPRHGYEREQPTANLHPGLEGTLIYHGPTSIYRAMATDKPGGRLVPIESGLEVNYEHVARHFGIDIHDEIITSALMLFFKWQYPHFMFVYREAFLRDHFGDRLNSKYWSLGLLLSMCALGSLMFHDRGQREMSERFYSAAESILIVSGLPHPSMTTVQGFLCLAFYEIGRGALSKGWGFSGIAFRMAHDLGFQRDPKHWVSHDSSLATAEDIEIRRRIYWGCYASDKLISLMLGRPVYLSHSVAEVELMERLPDTPEMISWLPAGSEHVEDHKEGNKNVLVPCFKEQIKLAQIIERLLSTLTAAKSPEGTPDREECLSGVDLDLVRWLDFLPECARWNRWERTDKCLTPSVAALHLLFYSVRIGLHQDRLASPTEHLGDRERSKTQQICLASAQDVVAIARKYRSQHRLGNAPLILVYAAVQARRVLQVCGTTAESEYLTQALEEASTIWGICQQVAR